MVQYNRECKLCWKEKNPSCFCLFVYLKVVGRTSGWEHYSVLSVSDCCLMPNRQFFSYIMGWTSYILIRL
jgi:hypothetical protein